MSNMTDQEVRASALSYAYSAYDRIQVGLSNQGSPWIPTEGIAERILQDARVFEEYLRGRS